MINIHSTLRSALAGLALAVASAGGAQALTVPDTVDIRLGEEVFTLGTLTGEARAFRDELEMQPWFGDGEAATIFAIALGDALGRPNAIDGGIPPLFAFQINPPDVRSIAGSALKTTNFFNQTATYAVVEAVAPIPVPPAAALMLAGLGALGLIRRRRG